ncbi:MAG: hypothetical protein ACI97K_001525 [Glaciecola sp.]|jgi:hypothetical protein
MCETETSCNPRFMILIFCQNFVKVDTEKIQGLIGTIIQYINVWNKNLRTSELAGIEASRQSEFFIELLRSAICQRRKNNLMTVSNGQVAKEIFSSAGDTLKTQ